MNLLENNPDNNISCEIIQDILPLYHDHVCSDKSRALVEEHLKNCAVCSNMLAAMDDETIETDLKLETHDILKKHEKKELSLAFKTGIILAGILILPVIIAVMITLPGYSDWKTDAVLIASMLLVAGLTVVPLVSTRKRLSKTILFSTIALLFVIFFTEMFFTDGGILYFAETAFSTVFGLSIPLFPILVWQADLPETWKNHRGLLCLSWDTLWFYLMIFTFCIAYPDSIHDLIFVSTFFVTAIWLVFLTIRYLPFNGLIKAGLAVLICGMCVAIGNGIGWITLMEQDLHMQIGVISILPGTLLVAAGIITETFRKKKPHQNRES